MTDAAVTPVAPLPQLQSCANCYFLFKNTRCARREPVVVVRGASPWAIDSQWPTVAPDDWCGEWKQRGTNHPAV